jgi:phosphoribosylglycinamide formyltransferase 1
MPSRSDNLSKAAGQTMHQFNQSDAPLRLGIITYDRAHLKTEQLVQRLLLKRRLAQVPRFDITLLALPFVPRPSRAVLLAHRPDQERSVGTRELAAQQGIDFLRVSHDSVPDVADYYVVAGAGILTANAIGNKKVVNVHPGIIPAARGLDAFKWSIFDGVPLGVTLHFIDAQVDAGETIAVVKTPIFLGDTLDVLARRHYELELDVLAEFLTFLSVERNGGDSDYPGNPPHMRMPIDVEREMVARFDAYKERFSGSRA